MTCDREVTSFSHSLALLCNDVGQNVHTLVHLTPSSIICCRRKNREDYNSLLESFGLPPIILGISSVPASIMIRRGVPHRCVTLSCVRVTLSAFHLLTYVIVTSQFKLSFTFLVVDIFIVCSSFAVLFDR